MKDIQALWRQLTVELLPVLSRYRANLDRLDVAVKDDQTLLTEADVEVQDRIVDSICAFDASATIVAEERAIRLAQPSTADRVWVIDPIDGTREFVTRNGREFCTVVTLVRSGRPDACYVLAPELGHGGRPVEVTVSGSGAAPQVNAAPARSAPTSALASATRSRRTVPRPFELIARQRGLRLKTRTTSQTLDMVRTCVDLRIATGLASFRWFYREDQKLWDGVAGIALALATGRGAIDRAGRELSPIPASLLGGSESTFASTAIGTPRQLKALLSMLNERA